MRYYDPTDMEDVKRGMAEFQREGFGVSLTEFQIVIKNATAKYNKNLKWYTEISANGKLISSEYTWTLEEVLERESRYCLPLPIGRTMAFHFNEIKTVEKTK